MLGQCHGISLDRTTRLGVICLIPQRLIPENRTNCVWSISALHAHQAFLGSGRNVQNSRDIAALWNKRIAFPGNEEEEFMRESVTALPREKTR